MVRVQRFAVGAGGDLPVGPKRYDIVTALSRISSYLLLLESSLMRFGA